MSLLRKAVVVKAVTPGPVGKPGKRGLSPVAKAAVITSPGRRRR